MLKILGLLITILILITGISALAQKPDSVVMTRWIDPLGRRPLSFSQYKEAYPGSQLHSVATTYRKTPRLAPPTVAGEVALIIEASLYPHIQASLDQYTSDLTLQGYTVALDTMSGGTSPDLRAYLQSKLPDIVGAVLVGDLPVAWYEMGGEEFPIDYYFMDLNGTWADNSGNGLLDSHYGATAPEIWVGRIVTSRLTWGDEVALLRNYFEKNHAYREGILTLPRRALAFDDDDWRWSGSAGLELAYSDVTVVNDSLQTNAANYKSKLGDGFEFVHIMSHSCPWVHTFYPYNYGGSVYNFEINLLDPQAFFYNLFACSNARFVEADNLGNWYIFADTYGLWAVGSTKTGAMHPWTFDDFYAPLGSGDCLGDAFKTWFALWAEADPSWHYGMTMLGDPTLQRQSGLVGSGKEDPRDRGETTATDWAVHQITTSTFSDGQPAIAVDPSGWVYVAWASGRNVRSNIYESHYNGTSWSTPVAIAPHEYWDLNPELVVDGSGIPWVVWHSFRDATHNIYSSYFSGSNWSPATRVSSFDAYDLEPAVAADSLGGVWVAFKSWRDANANIYTTCNTGGFWAPPTRLTTDPGDDCNPSITVDKDGNIWVFWYSNRNEDWDLYASNYDGFAWSPAERITSDVSDDLTPVSTVDALGNIWVLWKSYRDGNANIYSKYYDSSSWSALIQITTDSGEDLAPSLTCTPSNVLHCTWRTDRSGNWEIYESHYEGASWSSPSPVTAHPSSDMASVVTADNSGEVWTAWQTERNGNWDIYAAIREQVGTEETPVTRSRMQDAGLCQNFPNPFRASTQIEYGLPNIVNVRLDVYDLSGRLVSTLVDESKNAGSYTIVWDGRDKTGKKLASGVYFYRLRAGDHTVTKAMHLLR